MGRYMKGDEAYRAVIVVKTLKRDSHGAVVPSTAKDFIGPYDTPGVAKAQVTKARNIRGNQFVDGWVEEVVSWKRLED